jgi:hypothetical protein
VRSKTSSVEVLEAFVVKRLIILDDDRVELAHDALLHAQPRLRSVHQLGDDAAAWCEAGQVKHHRRSRPIICQGAGDPNRSIPAASAGSPGSATATAAQTRRGLMASAASQRATVAAQMLGLTRFASQALT